MSSESKPIAEIIVIPEEEVAERLERATRKAERGDIGVHEAWQIEPGWLMFDTSGVFPRNITLRVEEVDVPNKRVRVNGGDKYGWKWVSAEHLRGISDVGMEAFGKTRDAPGTHDLRVGIEELTKRPS